jgi:hypothetical protein
MGTGGCCQQEARTGACCVVQYRQRWPLLLRRCPATLRDPRVRSCTLRAQNFAGMYEAPERSPAFEFTRQRDAKKAAAAAMPRAKSDTNRRGAWSPFSQPGQAQDEGMSRGTTSQSYDLRRRQSSNMRGSCPYWPDPIWPVPAIVLSTLVSTQIEVVPTIPLAEPSDSTVYNRPFSVMPSPMI